MRCSFRQKQRLEQQHPVFLKKRRNKGHAKQAKPFMTGAQSKWHEPLSLLFAASAAEWLLFTVHRAPLQRQITNPCSNPGFLELPSTLAFKILLVCLSPTLTSRHLLERPAHLTWTLVSLVIPGQDLPAEVMQELMS